MANKVRISKILKDFNIGISTVVDFLKDKGIEVEANPNDKVSEDAYTLVAKEFGNEKDLKKASKNIKIKPIKENVVSATETPKEEAPKELTVKSNTVDLKGPKIVGKLSEEELTGKKAKKEEPRKEEVKHEKKEEAKKERKEEPQKETITAKQSVEDLKAPKIVTKIDVENLSKGKSAPKEAPAAVPAKSEQKEQKQEIKTNEVNKQASPTITAPAEIEFIRTKVEQLAGPNVVGKIDLKQFDTKKSTESKNSAANKKKRQRIRKDGKVDISEVAKKDNNNNNSPNKKPGTPGQQGQGTRPGQQGQGGPKRDFGKTNNSNNNKPKGPQKRAPIKKEVDEEAVQRQVRDTLARLTANKGRGGKGARYRKEKRDAVSQRNIEEQERQLEESSVLKVTEFVTVNELATMMDVQVIKVIEACMNLGLMVSINQRLDAEALVLVAEEFGYTVEFIAADLQDSIAVEEDKEEDLQERSPIITVMGHVDHGKTSLLDYIRKANVTSDEAGGITQHIGAYSVKMDNGKKITFLDTPGHEAFTAMRARGAKITDVVIIIVAADDAVMPQTIEAINHASAAGVPIVFAINKIDKPGANPEKIREQLASMDYLLEDWGGKYQSQEISAKKGLNIDKLLEKVLLEAEMLELRANPNKRAVGTVIESALDKGRGFITTMLVQSGTLKVGDIVLSGSYTGRVKAMFNERGKRVETALPSTPVLMLGLNGAPTAGESFNVMVDEKEARDIANKREQLMRMQDLKTKKHITLDEIGRRIAIGSFKELNVIIKGDVDGSIEALSDSLIKLSTEEVQVNVIHKAVGAISESDVLLAVASNAIIIGFQVRPAVNARKLADQEEIEIRLYSVIYDAINEVKDGIEGMLEPEQKEEITSTVEILEVFKISKVGTIAGCIVREGKIVRNSKIRIIRDGIVVYTGTLGTLKRFKEDVKEVTSGYECGLNIVGYNDIKVGDFVESYDIVEVKRKL